MKKILKFFVWVAAVLLFLLTAFQIAVSERVATSLVNRYVPLIVKGADVNFGRASVHPFRHFPYIGLNVGDVVLSIPSRGIDTTARFNPGLSEDVDTLAYIKNLDVSFNLPALIAGRIEFPDINLSGPKLFYRKFADSTDNWTPFLSGFAKDTTDSSSSSLAIILEKIKLDDRPFLYYSNPSEKIMLAAGFKCISYKGRFNTARMTRARGRLRCDSLFLSGIRQFDSVLFALNKLDLKGDMNGLKADVNATLFANLQRYGRMAVPVSLDGRCSFAADSLLGVDVPELALDIAGISLKGVGAYKAQKDSSSYVKLKASVGDCSLEPLMKNYASHFWDDADLISTDAKLDLDIDCDGVLDFPSLPKLSISLSVPQSGLKYSSFPEFDLMLECDASSDSLGRLNATVDTVHLDGNGLSLGASADAEDLLGNDPSYRIVTSLSVILDDALKLLPDSSGISGSGTLEGKIGGRIRQSQMNVANIAKANLGGLISGEHIEASMSDKFSAEAGNLRLALGAMGNKIKDEDMRPDARLLALMISADTLAADVGTMTFTGKTVSVKAHNSAEIITGKQQFYPFAGTVKAGAVTFRDGDSLAVAVRNTEDSFNIRTSSGVPVLSLKGNLGRVLVRSKVNRIGVKDIDLGVSARMNTFTGNAKRKALLDSLEKVYPGVPRDSLFRVSMLSRRQKEALREDAALKSKDLNIRLAKSFGKYYREWDISGSLNVGRASLATPKYPLRTGLRDLSGSFTNDRINLDSISVRSGVSRLQASGSLSNLKRALFGRGPFVVDMDLNSGRLDLDEVVTALKMGKESKDTSEHSELSDTQYEETVTLDSISTEGQDIKSFIVPADLQGNLRLLADSIQYLGVAVQNMRSYLEMKDRCIQMTNSAAITNMGRAFFEGFYATPGIDDMKLGFILNLMDVTAEKVIDLVPAIDTLVPMLKNFTGVLDCQLAATARMDTDMNILVPSINGVAKISGEDLTISNDEIYTALARKLLFRNPREGKVNSILIQGLIGDSKVEVFPFVLSLDRYQLAMSGVQFLDKSFQYHVSVLKSPLPFKVGLNLDGSFSSPHVSLVRPKYRNATVPAFTSVINASTVNMMESIHNIFNVGAEKALQKNEAQEEIRELKKEIDYVQAVDMPSESFSKSQEKKLKMLVNRPDSVTLENVRLDTLTEEQFDSLSVERLDSLLYNKSDSLVLQQ